MQDERRTTVRQTALTFSLGGTAIQVLCCLIMIIAGAYLAYQFGFQFDDAPTYAWRHRTLLDLFRSNHGKTGLVICSIFALGFAYWMVRAGWRFFSGGKAAVLTERGVLFHRSSARAEIPYRDISAVEIGREFFGKRNLYVRVPGKWRIRLQSNEVEGGKEALEAFAAELNARRTFGDAGP